MALVTRWCRLYPSVLNYAQFVSWRVARFNHDEIDSQALQMPTQRLKRPTHK